jgi:methylenetetrahydrofolate reductase (NADPH)
MASNGLSISFEFFPPREEEGKAALLQTVKALAPFSPHFVSVTFGAGGTTRAGTHEIVTAIQKQNPLKAAAHLTCVGMTRGEIDGIAQGYWDAGIRRIVALRGDTPGMRGPYAPMAGGYAYTSDLVQGLKKVADFDISVAGYPEKHPEAPSMDADLAALRKRSTRAQTAC